MTKKWPDTDTINPNEAVGRRLFDEPMLMGVSEQPSFGGIQLNQFEETRSSETSLDRLGQTGVDKKIKRFLVPLAERAGQGFHTPRQFNGWAVIRVKDLTTVRKKRKFEVVPSPVTEPPEQVNPYHCHVVRPDDMDANYMALHMRQLFTAYGHIERHSSAPPPPTLWAKMIAWAKARLKLRSFSARR